MKQNSFQKNGFLNVNGQNSNSNGNIYNQFGRRNIQDIRDDMWNAKNKNNVDLPNVSEPLRKNKLDTDVKKRIENLQNLNRWKG